MKAVYASAECTTSANCTSSSRSLHCNIPVEKLSFKCNVLLYILNISCNNCIFWSLLIITACTFSAAFVMDVFLFLLFYLLISLERILFVLYNILLLCYSNKSCSSNLLRFLFSFFSFSFYLTNTDVIFFFCFRLLSGRKIFACFRHLRFDNLSTFFSPLRNPHSSDLVFIHSQDKNLHNFFYLYFDSLQYEFYRLRWTAFDMQLIPPCQHMIAVKLLWFCGS